MKVDYAILVKPAKKCSGVGWPVNGLNNCCGCDRANPPMTRTYLVASHYMTQRQYLHMLAKAEEQN